MICPLMTKVDVATQQTAEYPQCFEESCQWWDSKANFNPETKQYEGQCCILTLSRLKVSGLITTHPG